MGERGEGGKKHIAFLTSLVFSFFHALLFFPLMLFCLFVLHCLLENRFGLALQKYHLITMGGGGHCPFCERGQSVATCII